MDVLTFIVRLVEVLVWPAVVGFVYWDMRDRLGPLTTLMFEWKDAKVRLKFGEVLDKAEEKLPSPVEITRGANELDRLAVEAQLPPAYLVQQSWLRLELAVLQAAKKRRLIPDGRETLGALTVPMLQNLGLSKEDAELIDELRWLRNLAVHSTEPTITATDALRYKDLAESMARHIELNA